MAVSLKDLTVDDKYKSYLLLFVANIILLVSIYSVLDSENISSWSKYVYILFAMSIITGLLFYNVVVKSDEFQRVIISMLVMFVFVVFMYQFDSTSYSFRDQVVKYSTYFVGSLCVLVGLAMLVTSVYRSLRNISGIPGFIIEFIFYLPCVINEFIDYIKGEFNLTPSNVYILFAIEMILIFILIAISYIPRISINLGGTPILSDTVFLDSKYVYKNVNRDKPVEEGTTVKTGEKSTNRYAISLWTFVNQRTHQSERSVNIFSYGSDTSWKPRIEFVGKKDSYSNTYKDKYLITVAPGVGYEVEIASQKWNNFVFNYNGDVTDLFINGVLVRSFQCMPKYNESTDQFIIGDDKGIYGAICNLNYYNEPLSLRQITSAYNLLNGRNPPINNI